MPTIVQTVTGKVTGLWGSAIIRGADGKTHALKLGDIVNKGDVILTTQNGIVQLSPASADDLAVAPVKAVTASADIDRVITQLNQNDPKAATAAGAGEGALGEGLRVGRVVENVTPLAFEYGTAGRGVGFDISGTAEAPRVADAVANPDIATGAEGAPIRGNVLGNDAEGNRMRVTGFRVDGVDHPAGQPATIAGVGTLVINADGSFLFTPLPGFNGAVPVANYTATDGVLTSSATLTLNITPVDDAPVTANDTATGAEDTPITGNVLSNDSDPEGKPLAVTRFNVGGVDHPAGQAAVLPGVGTLVINTDGSYTFTPLPNYNGPVPVATYTATDGALTSTATLTLNVTPVNDAPAAANDTKAGPEGTPITGNVLANDSDVDGTPLSVTSYSIGGISHPAGQATTLPGVGDLVINADGSYTFTPLPNYNGPVPVATYTATDGTLTTTATLTLNVTPVNDPPIAGDDIASTPINTPVTIAVLGNDTDADGDVLTVSNPTLANPAQGTVSLNPDGTLRFTPANNLTGTVSITYTVTDPNGGTDTATVLVNVGNNTPPDSADKTISTPEDTPHALTPADFAFSDADAGQTLNAVRIDTLPASGALLLNGTPVVAGELVSAAEIAAGKLVFVPDANDNGAPYASFNFSVQDSGGAFDSVPNTVTLNVTPVNDPPVAVDDTQTTDEDTPVTLSVAALLGNDTDVDGDPLTLVSVQTPLHGTVAIVAGSVVFTPEPNYNGPASFTYTISDGQGGTSTATVNIDVKPVVDPAISISDVTVNEAAGTATFTVTLDQPTTAAVSVHYQTADGSATSGADYTAGNGTLNFAPGVTTQTVTVQIANDALFERSENFSVNLSLPTNATIADGVGLGTILDDGTGPGGTDNDMPVLAVTSGNVVEGANAVFTVTLSNVSTTPVVFTPSLASGSATVGTDTSALPALQVSTDGGTTWQAVTGNVTIPALATGVLLRLPTTDDTLPESPETFTLTATPVSGAQPFTASAATTIIDNDGAPSLFINDVTVNEAAGTATFTVTLSPVSGQTVTVDFATSNGTATAGAGNDYTAQTGTLTFAPGNPTLTITVPILNDGTFEGSETFTVTLSNPVNAIVSDGLGLGTIKDDGTGPGGTDNDTPQVGSVSSPTVVEGNNLDFNVTLTHPSTTPTTVALAPASGTATLGSDTQAALVSFDGGLTFSAITGPTVSVPAGATSFIVRVPTIDDPLSEPTEAMTLAASTPANAAPIVGTGTITDNEAAPTLSISGPVLINEAAGTATFTITLSTPSSAPVSVNYGTVNGSATAGSDFDAATGTLTFASGVTSQTVTVSITDDSTFEGLENFSVVLSAPSGATIATGTATTTIADDGTGPGGTDNDAPAVSSVSSPTVVEGNNLDFNITLSNPSTTPTTVTLTPASGTATLGTDTAPALVSFDGGVTFALVVGSTVAVPAGATSFIVRVPTVADTLGEPTETMTLGAQTPVNTAAVVGTGTITDNDTPVVSISGPAVIDEAAGTATYTVTLSNPASTPVSVNYATANGTATAGADYLASTGALNFAAGETSKTIVVSIVNDTTFEGSETLSVNLSAPTGAVLGTATVNSQIVDDGRSLPGGGTANDDTPNLSIANISVAEGAPAVFVVTLSNPSASPVVFTPSLASGTATLGTDTAAAPALEFFNGAAWVPVAGNVTIAAGATSVQLRLATVDDVTSEPNETFTLTATPVSGSAPAAASGIATIVDNDGAPQFSVNDVTVNEGAGTITFTVTLSNPAAGPVSINYAAASDTANVPADVAAGLNALAGTLNFAAGVTSQTITLNVVNDSVFEGSESFNINLSGASAGTVIADALGVGTIRDDGTGPGGSDNDTPVVSISGPAVIDEAAGTATYTVTLSNPSTSPVTVLYSTANGTATAGSDYTANTGTLTFAPGALTQTITVAITNDTTLEVSETLNVNLSAPSGATLGTASVTSQIIDDGRLLPGGGTANNDTPVISITGPAVIDEAAGTATYTVTLTNPSTSAVTVNFATANGTATAGSDYTTNAGTLTFAPGTLTQTITVAITDDAALEVSETLSVSLSAPSGATLGTASVTSQIVDDGRLLPGGGTANNDTPVLNIAGPAVIDEAAGTATYTVTLTNPSASPITVNFATANGTASAGSDYTATSGTLTFAPGTLTQTITVAITNDLTYEGSETLNVNLTAPNGATLGTASVTSQIVDDGRTLPGGGTANNDTPVVSITGPAVIDEAAGTATYTVTLSNASTSPVAVNFATANGTALAGTDYTATSGTLNFAPGTLTQTITVAITNDTTLEVSETLSVNLTAPSGATLGTASVTSQIVDDGRLLPGGGTANNDTPVVSITGPAVIDEGAGTATYTVTLTNPSTSPVTVNFATANGTATAGSDYTTNSGTLTFAPGTLTQTITVAITDDTTLEVSETLSVNLSAPTGATLGTSTVTSQIVDDGRTLPGGGTANNDTPVLNITGPAVIDEAAGTATYTVTLTNPSTSAVTVSFATANGTATAGSDYTTNTGTLTFAPGILTQTITVAITNDTALEVSETLSVNLSAPSGATLGTASVTSQIVDDGRTLPGGGTANDDTPSLSVSNVTVAENAGFAVFTVALSNPSTQATTVSLAPAAGTATSGVDYNPSLEISTDGGTTWTAGTTATIAAGQTSVLVRSAIVNDTLDENSETFTLTATRTAGATSNAAATGTATITDDDPTPTLAINDVTVNEAAGTATFTVTLSAASGLPVSVGFNTSNGSATAGADYAGTTGTLTFAPGVTSQTITVAINNDTAYEGAETFNVNLVTPTNATIADNLGLGTIRDDGTGTGGTDDDTPALSVTNVTVAENAGFAVFSVAISNPSTQATTVNLATTAGTATSGADYSPALEVSSDGGTTWTAGTTATIAAGQTSVLVRSAIVDDTLNETSENFTLTATRTAGTTTNAAATGSATITDNDAQPSLVINDVTVNEAAGTATFTVSLSAASGLPVTVGFNTSNGTATAGADYTATTGTLTFAAGVTSQTITVNITNDTTFETAETFNVNLITPTNATIADNLGLGTIRDDGTGLGGTDDDTPALSVSSVTVAESAGFAVFSVALSNASTQATTVNLATAAGTATSVADYNPALEVSTDGGTTWVAGTTATIAAGQTSVLVRSAIVNDTLNEASETFTLTATRTAGTTTNAAATGTATITDNDAQPSLAINDVTVNEAAGTATFTVTLSAASGLPVTVGFNTSNGTATAAADYTSATGTLSFAPGTTTQTVTVNINNDTTYEGAETFNVNLVTPTNATIADALGVGTIRDDGTGTGGTDNDTPTLSVTDVTVAENAGFAVFSVALSNASTQATTVNLATAAGTATSVADYNPSLEVSTDGGTTWTAGTTATIAAGQTSVLVRSAIVNDTLNEASENFTLTATRTAGTTTNAAATGTATITDNDAQPSLTINDVTVNEAAGTATFTVTLSAASGLPVTVGFNTSNGTATAGADYTTTTGTLTFAAGVTSQTITVNISNDTTFELAETFNVNLVTPTNATIADNLGLGTIRDDGTGTGGTDNDTPALTVSSVTVAENAGFAVFSVAISNASTQATTVNLATTAGTATSGADFNPALEVSTDGGTTWALASTATIAAGLTSVLVRSAIVDDALNEPSENFTLTATRTAGTTSNAAATGTATITDNDAPPSLVINDVVVNEAAGTATFTVTLSAVSSLPVTVGFNTSNGTATAGADYATTTGTLTFAPGITSQTITVSITNDATFETSESFNVNLTTPTNATIADNLGLGTIRDDGTGTGGTDNDTPSLSVSSVTVAENAGFAVFSVALSNVSTQATTVNLATAAGTATSVADYNPSLEVSTDGGTTWTAGTTATIAAGQTSVLVRSAIVNDTLNEASENFTLTATRTAGTTTNAAATGTATITDNDPLPSLVINDVVVNEAAGTATFTVTLSAASGLPVTVGFNTSNGTATAGADYTATTGSLTFAAGVTSQTITVGITNDTLFETSETFNVNLVTPTNATIADNLGLGTIRDDGTGTGGTDNDTPALTVSSITVAENAGFAVFSVALSNASTQATTVNLTTTAGTATSGVDYTTALQVSTDGGTTWTAGSTATIAAGLTSVLVRAPIVDDTLNEASENFTLTATRTAGTTTNAAATGSATITDNDAQPSLVINDVTVNEAAGTATFTVTLSAVSGLPVTVGFNTSNGTATAGADYTATTGSLTFAAGVTSQTITVNISNDTTFELAETFNVNLVTPTNATIADNLGLGTIRDDGTGTGGTDNDTPALTVSSVTVAENAGFAVFSVAISNASTQATTVNLATTAGTATSGADFNPALEVSTDGGTTWALASTATIAAGLTSVLVRAPIVNDAFDETNETFTLTATRTAGTTTNAAATGTATITDDDPTPTLVVNDVTVNEAAGTATFTVTLSAPSNLAVSVGFSTSNGSATAGADYTATSGTLNFAAGETTKTITVNISEDTLTEASETFNVNLTAAVNANIADALGLGTITDNDTPPLGRDATVTTLEDTTFVFSLANFLMNDAEQGNNVNPTSVRIDTLPNNGSLYLNGVLVVAGAEVLAAAIAGGQLQFVPTQDANGNNYANFTFSVKDATNLFDTAPNTITVNVTPVSDGAPLAGNDNFLTTLGTPVVINQSQLLSNDFLPDHARITGLSAVTSGTLVDNGNGTYTYTPTVAGNATFTYTLTDDDGQTSVATVTVQTVSGRDDLATVNESALPTGTGAGVTVATGNLFTNDGGGTSVTNVNGVTDGAAGDTDTRAGYIGINTTVGNLVVDSAGAGAGDYTYTLLRAADNSAAANNNGIVENFSYVSNVTSANLRVTVVDDAPVAYTRTVQVSEDAAPDYRLVLVLDVSGSMTTSTAGGDVRDIKDDGSVVIRTRLDLAREALAELVSEYFNQAQNVSITLVTFSGGATIVNPGAPYTTKDAAVAAIMGATGSGGTNYEAALTAVQTAFGVIDPAVKNTVYFVSDGAPSQGELVNPAGTSGYSTYATNNNIDSFAVGIGTGIANTAPLNGIHNVDGNGNGVVDPAIIVPNLNDLGSALLSTVPIAYGGNVISSANVGNVLGADGGYVQSLTIRLDTDGNGTPDSNVVFTYNKATNQISHAGAFPAGFPITGDLLTLDDPQGFHLGTVTFNFSDGSYTYFTDGTAVQGDSFSFTFIARDGDGDVTAPATLTVQIADGHPTARPDTDTLVANQTHLDGNVISGLGTDGGQALGGKIASFASMGAGVDDAVDNAQVSSVLFKGASYNLAVNATGTGAGFTWTVAGGNLSWTATAGGEKLVFDSTGFYDYTPPTAALPTVTTAAAVTTTFTSAANAALNGVVLGGISRTGTTQTLTYTDAAGTTSDGAGVNGGPTAQFTIDENLTVDNLETLVVNFATTTHPRGVQGVSFVVASAASNLGNVNGTVSSLTYTVFDVAGAQIGQFYSIAEGTITVPTEFSNIGHIEIEANSAAYARITSVAFQSILAPAAPAEVAPTVIGYTLTDTDGDTSSASLTLRVVTNNLFGDTAANTITGTTGNDRIDGGSGNDTLNGGAGNDILIGGVGNDTLNGGDGIDELRGGAGNDVLNGDNGNDILVGGLGNDTMNGGAGSDVFRWEFADRGNAGSPAVDTVVGFSNALPSAGGDVLDLRDLLQGETLSGAAGGNLTSYLHMSLSGADTLIQVSSAGGFASGFNAGAIDQTIVLQGIDLTGAGTRTDLQIIQDLLTRSKLVVDGA